MQRDVRTEDRACRHCGDGAREGFPLDIAMAFQPIVDLASGEIFAHEALVRGKHGAPAGQILGAVDARNRYAFDQLCRVRAIEQAAALGIRNAISINFMPNAVYEPVNCLRTTLRTAERTGFPLDRLIFEFTETERIPDTGHVKRIIEEYRRFGLQTAIDDFGAGFSGLNLLADLQPDYLKIDMKLVRGIDGDLPRRSIVEGICATADPLGIAIIAEGIETEAERDTLLDLGIVLHQGYLYARPEFEGVVVREALGGLPYAPSRMSG